MHCYPEQNLEVTFCNANCVFPSSKICFDSQSYAGEHYVCVYIHIYAHTEKEFPKPDNLVLILSFAHRKVMLYTHQLSKSALKAFRWWRWPGTDAWWQQHWHTAEQRWCSSSTLTGLLRSQVCSLIVTAGHSPLRLGSERWRPHRHCCQSLPMAAPRGVQPH